MPPSPFEEFTGGILVGLATLDDSRRTTHPAREHIQRAATALAEAAEGTDRLSTALASLDHAAALLEQADAQAAAATEDLRSYLADIGATGAPTDDTQSRPAQGPHPPLRGPDPQKSAATRAHLGDPKTIGHLYDADGVPIAGVEELRSGRNGPGKGAPHLRYPHKHMTSLNEHVEGHVAAYMRTSRTRYVEVYTNRDPCPGENGCAERTAEALPDETYRMVVFSESEDGTLRTYFDGTGEGVDL